MKKTLEKYSFIFFGEDVFSLAVLESLVDSKLSLEPFAVVMLEPISVSGGRLVAFCEERRITLIRTKSVRSEMFLAHFQDIEIDLMISAHFQRILPESLFNRARLGAMNLHPSLLPKYRGMSPQHWPIVFGDTETGVTVHRIDQGVDTGDILQQVRIPLESSMYIYDLQKKFFSVYRSIMIEAVKRVIKGEAGDPQPKGELPYFPKISEDDLEITRDTSTERAFNMVRAFSLPYAGAIFGNLRIIKAELTNEATWKKLNDRFMVSGIFEYQQNRYLLLKDGALKIIKWKNA